MIPIYAKIRIKNQWGVHIAQLKRIDGESMWVWHNNHFALKHEWIRIDLPFIDIKSWSYAGAAAWCRFDMNQYEEALSKVEYK